MTNFYKNEIVTIKILFFLFLFIVFFDSVLILDYNNKFM